MSGQRIVVSGTVGLHDGFVWGHNAPSGNDIDADNDGFMVPAPEFVLDLSEMASGILGYQASMMRGYKLHRYSVMIRPVDDANDNDHGAEFAGYLDAYPATDHAKKALKMARQIEKADEANQVDADSLFLSDDIDYSGFRYGWSTYQTGARHATGNSISGMASEWLISEIFGAYDDMTEPQQSNALFGGRAPEMMRLPWRAQFSSDLDRLSTAQDEVRDVSLEILPILRGAVIWSTMDEPGLVDDDYVVNVTLEFTPEVGSVF